MSVLNQSIWTIFGEIDHKFVCKIIFKTNGQSRWIAGQICPRNHQQRKLKKSKNKKKLSKCHSHELIQFTFVLNADKCLPSVKEKNTEAFFFILAIYYLCVFISKILWFSINFDLNGINCKETKIKATRRQKICWRNYKTNKK